MYKLKSLPAFTLWLESLEDKVIKAAVLGRLRRIELGLKGDSKSVGNGVSELRIHVGEGWRIYFTERHGKIIVLLVGGSKGTQAKDIKKAKELASMLD